MPIILYGDERSPPVRATMLAFKALGLEYDFKKVSLSDREHMKPEFMKINPTHTLPTIQDGDFVLWDSHAIAAYLADKVGSDSWFPQDLRKRAIVNQRLQFDNALLFTRLRDMLAPVIHEGESAFQPSKIQRLEESLSLLSDMMTGDWVAGDKPTIADCCIAANVSSIQAALPDIKMPEKVAAWLKRCEENLPAYKTVNKPGLHELGASIQAVLASRRQ